MENKGSEAVRYETDVLVLGAGGAGLAAAIAAREKGAEVILLEKRRKPGGNTALAGGMFAAGSPMQERENIEVNKQDLFILAMDFAHWTINPRLIRAFINKSGDTLGWLEEKGITFTHPFEDMRTRRKFFNMYIPPVQHVPAGYGAGLTQSMTRIFEGMGGKLHCSTRAKELLADGQVLKGAIAEKDGKEVTYHAKCVILSTGDFGANKELMKKYCKYYNEKMFHKGVPNMGDGLTMGLKLGAGTANLGSLMVEPGWVMGEPNEMWYFTAIRNQPIWLNKRGERFVNEASYRTRGLGWLPVSWQPDCLHFNVFDESILKEIIEGFDAPHFKAFGRHTTPLTPLSIEEAKELLTGAASRGNVLITDSWEEAAEWIGSPKDAVAKTIAEYNEGCDRGEDGVMAKDPQYLMPLRTPPYYVIRCIPRYLNTMGGLSINEHTEVLDPAGEVLIPGLYATGDTAGGFECDCYNANLYGTFVGFAVNSGRIAGENAASLLGYDQN